MTGRAKFQRNKKIINLLAFFFGLLPNFVLIFLWDLISNHSQVLFVLIRFLIAKKLLKKCGDNIKFGTNVQVFGWKNLEIGSNVSIHSNSYIDANGSVQIEDNVSIAHNSSILSANHDWKDINIPIKYNPVIFNKVTIEEDVWIGCACRILAGVTVKSRSIIAAGAVVNKDVESNTIVGGVPAKLIKHI